MSLLIPMTQFKGVRRSCVMLLNSSSCCLDASTTHLLASSRRCTQLCDACVPHTRAEVYAVKVLVTNLSRMGVVGKNSECVLATLFVQRKSIVAKATVSHRKHCDTRATPLAKLTQCSNDSVVNASSPNWNFPPNDQTESREDLPSRGTLSECLG